MPRSSRWLASSGQPVRVSYGLLRALGVLPERHIPMAYLRCAEGQRDSAR